ncbi:MAG: ATP-binding cassette domain-containing protein, partial [Myxococcales bacterium]|nr:ATP-binding cassette domain-containing protein [Myxococcales bacterium]
MSAVVAIEDAVKRYGALEALGGVTLALEPGETVALIGHNGAGKTTLMKLALGLIRPEEGVIRVFGANPAGHSGAEIRRRIGFLPESVAFHGAMTGREVLAFYARLKRAPLFDNDRLLDWVGLGEVARRRVGT